MASECVHGGHHRRLISLNIKNGKRFLRGEDVEKGKWFTIGGLDWQLHADPSLGTLDIVIYCAPAKGNDLLTATPFKASCRLRLRSREGDDLQETFGGERTLVESSTREDPHEFGRWSDVTGDYLYDDGFIIDDSICMMAVIDVHTPVVSFGTERSMKRRFEDVKIILADAVVYANKGVLAASSEYFETLFFAQFSEREKDEVDLKDVQAVDFQRFKDVVHPPYADINDTNIASVVFVADKYHAADILRKCEEAIMNRMDPTDAFKILGRCDGMDATKAQILQAMTDQELDACSKADDGTLNRQTVWLLMQEHMNRRQNA